MWLILSKVCSPLCAAVLAVYANREGQPHDTPAHWFNSCRRRHLVVSTPKYERTWHIPVHRPLPRAQLLSRSHAECWLIPNCHVHWFDSASHPFSLPIYVHFTEWRWMAGDQERANFNSLCARSWSSHKVYTHIQIHRVQLFNTFSKQRDDSQTVSCRERPFPLSLTHPPTGFLSTLGIEWRWAPRIDSSTISPIENQQQQRRWVALEEAILFTSHMNLQCHRHYEWLYRKTLATQYRIFTKHLLSDRDDYSIVRYCSFTWDLQQSQPTSLIHVITKCNCLAYSTLLSSRTFQKLNPAITW